MYFCLSVKINAYLRFTEERAPPRVTICNSSRIICFFSKMEKNRSVFCCHFAPQITFKFILICLRQLKKFPFQNNVLY